VLMLGEIRDGATASLAVQAALSGHRLVSTLHAATPAGAIARLLEMGVEPYQITSALFGVVAQRLLRRRTGAGGYHGRVPAAEVVSMDSGLRKAVLNRADASELAQIYAAQPNFRPMRAAAGDLVAAGLTDTAEVSRVFGQQTDPT
jgi:general secretion pathway protein E